MSVNTPASWSGHALKVKVPSYNKCELRIGGFQFAQSPVWFRASCRGIGLRGNIHGCDNDRREFSREGMWSAFNYEVFEIEWTKILKFLYVTTITVNHETFTFTFLLPREFFIPICKMYWEPIWLYGLGQYIRREACFHETDYVTVPDVSLKGGPHPELVYFIVHGLMCTPPESD